MPLFRKIAVLLAALIASVAGGVVVVAPAQAALIPNAITDVNDHRRRPRVLPEPHGQRRLVHS